MVKHNILLLKLFVIYKIDCLNAMFISNMIQVVTIFM